MIRNHFSFAPALVAGLALLAGTASAQLPSNTSLQGGYYFRYLGVNLNNNPETPLAFGGTMTFDGKSDSNGLGTFTATGSGTTGTALGPAANNVYRVFSSGLIFMTNPLDASNNTTLYGAIGSGAVGASSTDTNFCDVFVAVPVSTSNSAASLNGKYYVASMEYLNGSFTSTRNTFFTANFDGKGGLGNVTINGTSVDLKNVATTQTSNGATYAVNANGSGTINFPAPAGVAAANVLLSGNKTLYAAPDGSYFIAGGATTYDFVIGIKALSGSPTSVTNGLYFSAYLQTQFNAQNQFSVYGADGSATEVSSLGVEIGSQRVNPDFEFSYDSTYAVPFAPQADGTVTYSDSQYVVGSGGNLILGSGNGSNYQLLLDFKAPTLSGSGVFLNPQAIVNAASSAPFTASVSPGEFISLSGTGMAAQVTQAGTLPFPTTLGGVQVTVSWVDSTGKQQSALAPLYYVSPTFIDALIPYALPGDGSLVTFQVSNGGTQSNIAFVYSGPTSPGIFTIPPGGVGNGAIQHADFSLVSSSSPAKVGETVQIYLTGMGPVTPAVATGAAAPSNPLAQATIPDVYIDGVLATVQFSGLTPGAAGLYQLNVTIPSGVTAGATVTIEIDTFDNSDNLLSVSFQGTIPISK